MLKKTFLYTINILKAIGQPLYTFIEVKAILLDQNLFSQMLKSISEYMKKDTELFFTNKNYVLFDCIFEYYKPFLNASLAYVIIPYIGNFMGWFSILWQPYEEK